MTRHVFPPEPSPAVPMADGALYPVRRIFCVGRNYAEHAREMGDVPDREAPFYFTKTPSRGLALSPRVMPYPCGTEDFHYEMEMVAVLGAPVFRAGPEAAAEAIFAYGAGLDMTRRDLQQKGKDRRRPWDLGKDAEGAAVMGPLTPALPWRDTLDWPVTLQLNGEIRQQGVVGDMIHSVPEILADLSRYYHLGPGDVIFTGTPAGVGAVRPGDSLLGRVGPLAPVELSIGAPE